MEMQVKSKIQKLESRGDLGALLEGDKINAQFADYHGPVTAFLLGKDLVFIRYSERESIWMYSPKEAIVKDEELIDIQNSGEKLFPKCSNKRYIQALRMTLGGND